MVVDYGATCTRCLQRQKGLETWLLGARVWHTEKLAPPLWVGYDPDDPPLPAVAPKIYEEIFGQPCDHLFKREGFGREQHSFLMSSIGCGQYPDGIAFSPRANFIEALYRLHKRVKNPPFARATYAVLDQLFPPNTSITAALDLHHEAMWPTSYLAQATAILNLIDSEAEWKTALDFFNNSFNGPAPFISDAEFLNQRLTSSDPVLRRGSAQMLADTPTLDDAKSLAKMLDSPDPTVRDQAAGAIIYRRHFDLFGKMLQRGLRGVPQAYSDAEIVKLLELDDPMVDDKCFETIATDQRIQFLDAILERLNRRNSEAARKAIAQLLAGPNPLSAGGDLWEKTESLQLPVAELKDYVLAGIISQPKSSLARKGKFLNAFKALALSRDPGLWDFLNNAYVREAQAGINEPCTDFMLRAMMEVDASRTENFLLTELKGEDYRRQTAALAGIGLIASPVFTDALIEFRDHPPKASPGNPYPPADMFKNPAYSTFIDFALHRCRRISAWTLERNEGGKYSIKRNG